ncbi:YlxR family protein [Spirulina major]|uniref:YlxR family protein n=1 Tax=Spirulina major TaxID=270636 RepID=UPI0009351876|nr:YlxR family protein [Spirulina major]
MHQNYRRCLACRTCGPKVIFWRIVRLHPTRTVQLDEGMGRSAYLCPTADCLQGAQKKNRLGRSLKTNIPDAIYDALWERLNQSSSLADCPTVKNPQN